MEVERIFGTVFGLLWMVWGFVYLMCTFPEVPQRQPRKLMGKPEED